jgi:hypothetical protein
MHRFKAKGISSRVFPKSQWVNPKDKIVQWNIVTGDKVNSRIPFFKNVKTKPIWNPRLPLSLVKTKILLEKLNQSIVKPTLSLSKERNW